MQRLRSPDGETGPGHHPTTPILEVSHSGESQPPTPPPEPHLTDEEMMEANDLQTLQGLTDEITSPPPELCSLLVQFTNDNLLQGGDVAFPFPGWV
jgi:hypothetical protein